MRRVLEFVFVGLVVDLMYTPCENYLLCSFYEIHLSQTYDPYKCEIYVLMRGSLHVMGIEDTFSLGRHWKFYLQVYSFAFLI